MIKLNMEHQSTSKIWYYTKDTKQKFGPFSDHELIKLIEQEILMADDYIWMTDLDEWLKIKDTIYAYYLKKEK